MNNWDEIDSLEDQLDKNIYFKEKKFKAPILAKDLIYHFKDLDDVESGINRGFLVTKDNKQIWRYNGGFYDRDGEELIRDKIQKILGSASKIHYKNEVIDWVKDDMNLQFDRDDFNCNPYLINLDNGTYDIKTKEFREHTPSDFFNYKLPIIYNPDAKINEIEQFLKDVHYLEDILVIQELLGYFFFLEYFVHKAFMFVGEGRNGKSTEINLMTTFLGKENISSVPLQAICRDRFSSYDLYGKLANLCSDLSSDALSNTGLFKMATGGDYLRAEKKFEHSFKFINTAKFVFSCNIIPECKDKSFAYAKRWIVIEFPNTFEGENCDKMILKKLTTEEELSGLFNWAIEGLHRLFEKQIFSPHRTLEDVQRFHAETQNPVFKFVEMHIERDIKAELTKDETYKQFIKFCQDMNYPTLAGNVFSIKFKQYAPWGLEEGQSRLKGMKKTWKGVKFKNVKQQGKLL